MEATPAREGGAIMNTRQEGGSNTVVLIARVAFAVEQLGAIFEVHGVVVIPAAASDEALGLEGVDDRLRQVIAPGDG